MSPNLSYSITGTFNLFVKDRSAFRLSGALSVQNRSHTDADLSVLETFQNYSLRRAAVNPKESQDFHNFCTVVSGFDREERERSLRATKRFFRNEIGRFSAQAEAEENKLEKRSLRGSCE